MAKFCDSCGRELGMFSGEEITNVSGRVLLLCSDCADSEKRKQTDEKPEQPTHQARPEKHLLQWDDSPPGSGRQDPEQQIPALKKKMTVMLAAAGILILGSVMAVVFLMGRSSPSSRGSSSAPARQEQAQSQPPQKTSAPARARPAETRPAETRPADTGAAAALRTEPGGTILCEGRDTATIKGRKFSSGGIALHAKGSCSLVLLDCTLEGSTALVVEDRANVVIKGGHLVGARSNGAYVKNKGKLVMDGGRIQGAVHGVRAEDDSVTVISSSTVSGKVDPKTVKNVAPESRGYRRWEDPFTSGAHEPPGMGSRSSGIDVSDRAEVRVSGGSVHGVRKGINAAGDSTVILKQVRVTVEAGHEGPLRTAGVHASKTALVAVSAGSIHGPGFAVIAEDSARILTKETQLKGGVKAEPGSMVRALAASEQLDLSPEAVKAMKAAARAEHAKIIRYGRYACGGVFDCYTDNDTGGRISGRIVMKVGKTGKITHVTIRAPRAPSKVVRCIRRLGLSKVISDFTGPEGSLVCEYAGTVMRGSQMISVSSDFLPDRKKTKRPRP